MDDESSESESDSNVDQENIQVLEETRDVSEPSQKAQETSQRSHGSEVINISQRSHLAEIMNSSQKSEKAKSQEVKVELEDKVDSQRSEGSQRSQHLGVMVTSPRSDLSDHSSGHSPRTVSNVHFFLLWFAVIMVRTHGFR